MCYSLQLQLVRCRCYNQRCIKVSTGPGAVAQTLAPDKMLKHSFSISLRKAKFVAMLQHCC